MDSSGLQGGAGLRAALVGRGLEIGHRILQEENTRQHHDNATAEGKDQLMLKYAGWPVHKRLLKKV